MAKFETALADLEADIALAQKSADGLSKVLKRLRAAAKAGHVGDIEAHGAAAAQRGTEAAEAAAKVAAAWRFDARGYLAEDYFQELREAAEAEGVTLIERDGRIYCFPLLVKIEPRQAGVRIDKKLERRIRPAELVRHLAAIQKRPQRFREDQFLELLYKGYELVGGRSWIDGGSSQGDVVPVAQIHDILTLMPGSDYSLEEFGRDLLLLDRKPDQKTRSGLGFQFSGSTLAKGKTRRVTVYDEGGRERSYIGLRFARAA